MIRVGIIGCGKIADAHAAQIQRIPGCKIVGVCDKEELMARQLFQRFPVEKYYGSVDDLLDGAKPDVVHITTPPQSHLGLGLRCLSAGCHIYVEKPFTVDFKEAVTLTDLAVEKKLKLTVGHDDQFSHATRRMRELIKAGYLGGSPIHMESYYCYNLGSEGYAKALLGDKNHWVRNLPGKLLQNVISHGICRIAEFLESENPVVIAHGFASPFLRHLGETDIIDELRVIISDDRSVSAYFTFSSQMRPGLHHFRVYGPKNGIMMDHDNQTVIRLNGAGYKSYLEKFVPSLIFSQQYLSNFKYNLVQFVKNDFHMKSGMKVLIEEFYKSIAFDTPLPISYREILLTTKIMDDIFSQLNGVSTSRASGKDEAFGRSPAF